jgi:hypothetical protein
MWNVTSQASQVGHELRPDVSGGMTWASRDAAVDVVVAILVFHVVDVLVVVVGADVVAFGTARTEWTVWVTFDVTINAGQHCREVDRAGVMVTVMFGFAVAFSLLHLFHYVEHLLRKKIWKSYFRKKQR